MITRQQALTADEFHDTGCERGKIYRWRRNGKTQTWVTRPLDYMVPIKFGLWSYDRITPQNAHLMHVPEECPLGHIHIDDHPTRVLGKGF